MSEITKRACSLCRLPGHRAGSSKCSGVRPEVQDTPPADLAAYARSMREEADKKLSELQTAPEEPAIASLSLAPKFTPDPYLEGIMNRGAPASQRLALPEPAPVELKLKPLPTVKNPWRETHLQRRWDSISELKNIIQGALENRSGWQKEARLAIEKD